MIQLSWFADQGRKWPNWPHQMTFGPYFRYFKKKIPGHGSNKIRPGTGFSDRSTDRTKKSWAENQDEKPKSGPDFGSVRPFMPMTLAISERSESFCLGNPARHSKNAYQGYFWLPYLGYKLGPLSLSRTWRLNFQPQNNLFQLDSRRNHCLQ